MPKNTLLPFEIEPCIFCHNKIEHLNSFRVIPKKISKPNFPQAFYNICKTTCIFTCDRCSYKFEEKTTLVENVKKSLYDQDKIQSKINTSSPEKYTKL